MSSLKFFHGWRCARAVVFFRALALLARGLTPSPRRLLLSLSLLLSFFRAVSLPPGCARTRGVEKIVSPLVSAALFASPIDISPGDGALSLAPNLFLPPPVRRANLRKFPCHCGVNNLAFVFVKFAASLLLSVNAWTFFCLSR